MAVGLTVRWSGCLALLLTLGWWFWANSAIGLVAVQASRGGFREDLR